MVVTRFALFPELKLHNVFWITAKDNPEFVLMMDLQIHTLELVAAKLDQLQTMPSLLRQWLEFFYYADQKSEVEMKVLLQGSNPAVQQAYDAYLQFNQSSELRQLEDEREKYLHDYNSSLHDAKQEGIAEGIEQGRAEGIAKGIAESIIRTLAKRFQTIPKPLEEQILAITDLECLKKLTDFAIDCKSPDEFATAVK